MLVRQGTGNLPIPSNWAYKSPEELEWGSCTMQTDIYSFGVTMYSAYTLKPPLSTMWHSYGKSLMQIISNGHNGILGTDKPEMMSDGLWKIVSMCWAMDPFQRPSMAEINSMLEKVHEDSMCFVSYNSEVSF
ncbi:hypothetical protein PILCRDRAFT_191500 [Piloderma croceum F 1598]|uniref:Protein kinase domain-containing protein n=1 Tax=Piloderma croceum (strain F 1598) TaxID=765440 RepID=A0A0C3CIU8_PILCF|nr:hypothetical protein PILCRDRAFT_191500 [Piloderma croceum F 1598]